MKKININQVEMEELSAKNIYFSIIESLLFVSGDPLKLSNIASIIECSNEFTRGIMTQLIGKYEEEQRGIKVINNNDEYQLVTKSTNSEYVQKLLKTNVRQSLSQASLETLAIIAYKQPITRVEIEDIRGVKSDRAIYTLVEKNLIKESGKKEVAGRPNLYSTTDEFLKHFDFNNLEDMPLLESFVEDNIEKIQEEVKEIMKEQD